MRFLDLVVALVALLLLYSSARTVASHRDVSLAARRRAKGSLALFLSLALLVLQDYHWLASGVSTGATSLVLLIVAGLYFLGAVRARRSSAGGS